MQEQIFTNEFIMDYPEEVERQLSEKNIENFTIEELRSKGDGSALINWKALKMLQAVRHYVARPLYIISAYRDPVHNQKVGGARGSYHLKGRAFDVSTSGWTFKQRMELVVHAAHWGFEGFGFYDGFIHLDNGPTRVWDRTGQLQLFDRVTKSFAANDNNE